MNGSWSNAPLIEEQKEALRRKCRALVKLPPCKRWRDAGYYDVPAAVLRYFEKTEGYLESRKLTGSSPTEWRPI